MKKGGIIDYPAFIVTLWLHIVTFAAVVLGGEGVLAVVAGAARLAPIHPLHTNAQYVGLIWEYPCVAIRAFVHAEVEFMTEFRSACVGLEGNDARLESLVAAVAIADDAGGVPAIMTGAARFTLFHIGHCCVLSTGLV